MRRSIWIPTLLVVLLASAGALWLARDTFGGGLMVNPGSLDFGSVTLGGEFQQMVIATNTGQHTEVVDGIVTPEGFQASRSGFQLEPGESIEVVVIFRPARAGDYAGELVFRHGDDEVHALDLLGGVTLPPALEVAPLAVTFGEVGVGLDAEVELELANRGGGELRVDALSAPKPFVAEPAELVVPPGETRAVTLRFAPELAKRFDASMTIRSNDPDRASLGVRLAGVGVEGTPEPRIEVNPLDVSFGQVPDCSGPVQWVTVRNSGRDPLTLSALRYPEGFMGPARSRRVGPGRDFSFPVTFAPRAGGAVSGDLMIFSNDPGAGTVAIGLSGSGAACSEEAIRQIASRRPSRGLLGGAGGSAGAGGGGELAGFEDPDFLPTSQTSYLIGDDGQVRLASYPATFSDANADRFSYDPVTGEFSIEGLQFPDIEAPLGESFSFDPIDVFDRVDELGDLTVPVTVTITGPYGETFEVPIELTTDVVFPPPVEGSFPEPRQGVPFGTGERPVLVGTGQCPSGSICDGQIFDVSIPIDVVTEQAQNAE